MSTGGPRLVRVTFAVWKAPSVHSEKGLNLLATCSPSIPNFEQINKQDLFKIIRKILHLTIVEHVKHR